MAAGAKKEVTSMEETVFSLPVLEEGSVIGIGDVWNCRQSERPTLENIFKVAELESTVPGYLEAHPVQDMKYFMSHVRNSSGKSALLAVSAEVGVELAGIIKVKGFASFDKEDAKNFKEEEMLCKLQLQTFVVRARPSVSKIVNPELANKIIEGTVEATHFVSEVRLGGYAYASLRFSSNMTHDKLELAGSLEGAMPVGPVTIGLKAELEFLDSEGASNYSKKITLTSVPPSTESPGNSVATMFDILESFPVEVEKNLFKPDLFKSPPVYGIPFLFKLTPISTLFDVGSPPAYILMEKDVLADFSEMLLTLNDFEVDNYYKGLIREQDSRLATFFADSNPHALEDSMHPWAFSVNTRELELQALAVELKKTAVETFKEYKKGLASLDQIRFLLTRYNTEFDYPAVLKSVLTHLEQGKELLLALRPSDATVAGIPDLFIFSKQELDDFWGKDNEYRLLMTVTTDGIVPPGIFMKFYTLAPQLESSGLIVRVLCPGIRIASEFRLDFKMQSTEVNYNIDEIPSVLSALEHILAAQSRLHTTSSKFANIVMSELSGFRLETIPIPFDTSLLNYVTSMTNEAIETANTRLKTIESLMTKTGLTFVLLSEFLGSIAKAVFAYRDLAGSLKDAMIPFSTIAGCYNVLDGRKEGPFLLVFVDSTLKAICLNPLDCRVLAKLLIEGKSLEILSPNRSSAYSLSPARQEELPKLLDSMSILIPEADDQSIFFAPKFETSFLETRNVLYKACFSPMWDFASSLTPLIMDLKDGQLVPVLIEYGWAEERGFSPNTDFRGLEEDLKKVQGVVGAVLTALELEEVLPNWKQSLEVILNNPKNPELASELKKLLDGGGEDDETLLADVKELLSTFQTSEDEVLKLFYSGFLEVNLQEICIYFLNKVDPLDEAMKDEITVLLNEKRFVKAFGTFVDLSFTKNYRKLQQWLEKMPNLSGKDIMDSIISCLTDIATFSNQEKECVWRNAIFRFIIEENLNNKLIAKIYQLFISDDVLPDWFPPSVTTGLVELIKKNGGSPLVWTTVWNDKAEMVGALRAIISRNRVPRDFNFVLLTNARTNDKIIEALTEHDALLNWCPDERYFDPPWGMPEIKLVLHALMFNQLDTNPEDPIVNPSVKVTYRPSPVQPQPDTIRLNAAWGNMSGLGLERLTLERFSQVQEGASGPPPFISQNNGGDIAKSVNLVKDFIWKKLRQGDITPLDLNNVPSYFEYPPILPQLKDDYSLPGCLRIFSGNKVKGTDAIGDETVFISRSDWMTLLLTNVDPVVSMYLLSCIAKSNCVPMFIPDLRADDLKVHSLTNYMTKICIPELDDFISQTKLLAPPYKLVVAIRFGESHIGKSTLLNQTILNGPIFASKFEPGHQHGVPKSRSGLVELTWLSSVTTQSDLYSTTVQPYYDAQNEMVLLANVHGSIFDMPESLIKELRALASGFLVFWKCESWAELKTKHDVLTAMTDSKPIYNVVINPNNEIKAKVEDRNIVYTDANDTTTKMQALVTEIVQNAQSVISLPNRLIGFEKESPCNELLTLIANNSVGSVQGCLKLQSKDLGSEEPVQDTIANPLWQKTIQLYCDILSLPTTSRIEELHKFRIELEQLSAKSSSKSLSRILKLQEEVIENPSDDETLRLLQNEIHLYRQLILSVYHLDRELNSYFQLFDGAVSENYFRICKENFAYGISHELYFDSQSLLMEYCFNPDQKLFVLSTIGLQSSFKSTLLNTLFGSGFGVGFGGCTNGINMRFLPLDENLRNNCDFDGILLLDSEGFQPHLRLEDSFLRKMTTFLLATSHLSLICVNNNNDLGHLKGSLEVALMSICRGKSNSQQPDIMLIDQRNDEVVENDLTEQLGLILTSVQNKLSNEITETGFKFLEPLELYWQRVLGHTLVHKIGQDTDYMSSIDNLHHLLIEQIKIRQGFPDWYGRTKEFRQHSLDDTILSFKSLEAMSETFELKTELDKVKLLLERTWNKHLGLIPDRQYLNDEEMKDLNRVPYSCQKSAEECSCNEAVDRIQGLNFLKSPKRKELIEESEIYSYQIQEQVVGVIAQIAAAQELRSGKTGGPLAAFLQSAIDEGTTDKDELWLLFKGYLASKMRLPSWQKLIENEIEEEYGSRALEQALEGVMFNLQKVKAFDSRHAYEGLTNPVDFVEDPYLNWEAATWLKLHLTKVTRSSVNTTNADVFETGMVRSYRQKIADVIRVELPDIVNRPTSLLSPEFVWEIHLLGLVKFIQTWKYREDEWLLHKNPLVVLEEKKDQFPNIFLPVDDEIVAV